MGLEEVKKELEEFCKHVGGEYKEGEASVTCEYRPESIHGNDRVTVEIREEDGTPVLSVWVRDETDIYAEIKTKVIKFHKAGPYKNLQVGIGAITERGAYLDNVKHLEIRF